ncbi:MAG: orotate phosphoribosyltransferase [Pseudanabaenaceae cyanobacterium bins.68]|nr:orotate phosphoribosyltransferase [Pseudanabaenaceae cyanobacterium bins.68]
MTITNSRAALLDLICTQAYQEGNFTLSSGQTSDYYINGKLVSLDPLGARWIGEIMLAALPASTKAVAGLTLGADPLVTAVSVVSAYSDRPISALIVRKQPKGHGTGAWIEGRSLPPGTEITVLEDVVTTGASALFAAEKLRNAGYVVDQVITLVDREQGGTLALQQAGLKLQPMFTIAEIQAHAGNFNQ